MENKWTDEDMKEFAEQYRFSSSRISLEIYKKSKEVKKELDFEILSFKGNYNEIVEWKGEKFHGGYSYEGWVESCLAFDYKIQSVKSLLDNEVFSIMDNYKGCPNCNTHYIISFELINDELIVKREDGRVINFATIIPVKKETLFSKDQESYINILIRRILNEISQK